MRGISGYAKVSLAALAIFLLGLLGHFLLNQSSGAPYTVRTETSASSAAQPVQEEPQKPDSLLEGERININTAPVADLCRLPGIGEKRAVAVAAYREEHATGGTCFAMPIPPVSAHTLGYRFNQSFNPSGG